MTEELRLQHGLAEGVTAGEAIGPLAGLDLEEDLARRGEILRAVAFDDTVPDRVDRPDRLQGAQGLVVDRNCSRLLHRDRVAFHQQRVHAIAAQQIGRHQAGGPATHHHHPPGLAGGQGHGLRPPRRRGW
jgi:hypothetical protein